jgi:hypothetical protein
VGKKEKLAQIADLTMILQRLMKEYNADISGYEAHIADINISTVNNFDNPEAEIFRIELNCYSAQIADNATHAVNADHATTADEATTAQSALTSSGSVSSISSPNDERQKIVIANGDGTTTKINIFSKANPEIYLVGASGQSLPFDSSFTVGHSEEYTAEDFEKYGWPSADYALQENINFCVVDVDRNTIFEAKTHFTWLAGYCVIVYDHTNTEIKVFSVTDGNSDSTLTLTRLM